MLHDRSPTDLFIDAIAEKVAEKMIAKVEEKGIYQPTQWVSMKDAAWHLGVSYYTFTEKVREGKIPVYEVCGKKKIDLAELDDYAKRDLL